MRVCPPRACQKPAPVPAGARLSLRGVKAMFWLYLVMVWGGIVYFSVIGLTHH
jgi:hypothetical protein